MLKTRIYRNFARESLNSMILNNREQLRRADIVIDAICEVGNVSYPDLITHKRSLLYNALRGVCCLLSWEYGIHPNNLKSLIMRSRSNVINQSRRYFYYLKTGDCITLDLYEKAKNIIDSKVNKQA